MWNQNEMQTNEINAFLLEKKENEREKKDNFDGFNYSDDWIYNDKKISPRQKGNTKQESSSIHQNRPSS